MATTKQALGGHQLRVLRHISLAFFCLSFFQIAHAQGRTHAQIASDIQDFFQARKPAHITHIEVEVSRIDPRVQLKPCSKTTVFLPPGSREWGKLAVGVRCVQDANWSLYVPTQVRAFGDYLATSKALSAGHKLIAEDLMRLQGDLGTLGPNILSAPEQAIGKVLMSSQAAGSSLHQSMFRQVPVIQSGQVVKLFAKGIGFTASHDGIALQNALEGQLTRVRTASGQIVSGYATADGSVEVR